MTKSFKTSFLAAVLGGAITAAILLLTGVVGSNSSKTIVKEISASGTVTTREETSSDSKSLGAREIYRRDAPGVVFISAKVVQKSQSPFGLLGGQGGEQEGIQTGSGFVIDKEGHILTNAHVIQGSKDIKLSLSDKRQVQAKVVGTDVSSDVALLKVDPKGLNLRPLKLGNSQKTQVGDPTYAIGNPFGLDRTLTTGVISALQRHIEAKNGFRISNVIQTDAAINRGNSGGPLIDMTGSVIGINSQIATSSEGGGSVGIAFAVPINTVKNLIPQLKKGTVQRAYLGVQGVAITPELKPLNLKASKGVLVQNVSPGTPAAKAGIRAGKTKVLLNEEEILLGGDIIQKVNGKSVDSTDGLVTAVASEKPGSKVTISIIRDGKTMNLTVKLTKRPEQL